MDSKLLFALLGFSLLLLGCAGGQPAAPSAPQTPPQQPPQEAPSDLGIELDFNESQSLEDLDAIGEDEMPQQLDDVDLTFNETESIDELDALNG